MNKLKNILILGAGIGQMPLIQRAKAAGWRTFVVSPAGNYPGFALADERCYADISDRDAILAIAQEKNISAIATDQTDVSVPALQYVAEKLGLPHICCSNIDNFHFKSRMRSVCQSAGLPTIQCAVVSSLSEAQDSYASIPSGLAIVKPTDSQGSRGVQQVTSPSDLEEAFQEALKYSKEGRVIIEQYIVGQEIEVDSILKDSRIVGCLIGDVFNFDVKNTFSAYERIYPSSLPSDIQQRIYEINRLTLQALGMRTGWVHGEYIVAEDGQIYLLEAGARGGGNFIGSHIVRTMLGVSTDEMAFATAIGDESFYDRVAIQDNYCAYKCFYLPQGIVESISIADRLLADPNVLVHNFDELMPGLKANNNTDKTSRYTILFNASSRELLLSKMQALPSLIDIKVETPLGLQSCIWK